MGVGPKAACDIAQSLLERFASACAAHLSLKTDGGCDLAKGWAVPMLAVVDGMNQLVYQGVEHSNRVVQHRRDKDLIDPVCGTLSRPALADGSGARALTGKAD
jgi:hypothetical protein